MEQPRPKPFNQNLVVCSSTKSSSPANRSSNFKKIIEQETTVYLHPDGDPTAFRPSRSLPRF
ncbi:hypothetical protein GJ744_004071 [Endocarpon pusillum]|uniref:Uncharacterized protein n=1 Tax=Endocarpon pusillum TaxID=364733 RepID=A0A8H7A6Y1_9EURO|nr:hypothetical protein GJ744_004071 [Endocarpon pusillum]